MKTLPGRRDADRLRVRRAHRRRPPHCRREGERPHRPAPLQAEERRLRRDPHVEEPAAGPSRDWLSLAASSRARNKIRQWFSRETREDTEQKGREALEQRAEGAEPAVPEARRLGRARAGDPRDGFKKAEDFYLALGSGKLTAQAVVNKVLQRLKTEEVAEEEAVPRKAPKRASTRSERKPTGSTSHGVEDVLVRLAKCCTPVPGDQIVGYISLGKGITIHREDCPNVKALRAEPGAVHAGRAGTAAPRRASASRSPSTRGTGRACSRTSRGRSPSTARTSSPTAAPSRTRWRGTGTSPRSAT